MELEGAGGAIAVDGVVTLGSVAWLGRTKHLTKGIGVRVTAARYQDQAPLGVMPTQRIWRALKVGHPFASCNPRTYLSLKEMDRLRSTEERLRGKVMSLHRAEVSIESGAVVLSAIGVGAAAATAVGPTSSVASAQQPARAARAATVHTAKATVGRRTETVLLNPHGFILYYYPPKSLLCPPRSFLSPAG
jgi:hypothetical protein